MADYTLIGVILPFETDQDVLDEVVLMCTVVEAMNPLAVELEEMDRLHVTLH
jgi:hypothetical protein